MGLKIHSTEFESSRSFLFRPETLHMESTLHLLAAPGFPIHRLGGNAGPWFLGSKKYLIPIDNTGGIRVTVINSVTISRI